MADAPGEVGERGWGPGLGARLTALRGATGIVWSMKRALIIGAGGGIGSALVARLEGYEATLVGRDGGKLNRAKRPGDEAVPTDVTSELEVEALFSDLEPLDLLVYAAGSIEPAPLGTMTADVWTRTLEANLTGLAYVLKYAENKLNPGARVFVLGARPELVTARGLGAYAAAKAGVAALVGVAAQEFRRKASFTLVLPKAVDTAFWENVGKPPKDALRPEEVAEAMVKSLAGEPERELRVG